ncbi:hypothetical protein H5410_002882 [Solanum commersonii]|uniref:DUF4283 domain-containing protein n=1 Tax=Solanum commersonii TaxID=4109 RepID=A0A9J6B334_SOLCO|nr:hypothetical protein H5410_002882 [Solanum commersonii]
MIIKEKLNFVVIGKFSYGWPEINDLRKIIPEQCDLKEECNIRLSSNKHVLLRASFLNVYANCMALLPGVTTQFFLVKEAMFSLAAAIGKPLQVDLDTTNLTWPSCVRAKVEVDLLSDIPKRINVGMRKKSREVCEKWIRIMYDYVPKCCKNCKIQGHNKDECFFIQSELYPMPERKNENQEIMNKVEKKEGAQGKFIPRKEEQSKQNGKGEIK